MSDARPLLEREGELGALAGIAAAAHAGDGRAALIEGPAGIGKTRLLAGARAEAERRGFRLLGARGSEMEREFSYGVVRQLLEGPLLAAGAGERAELLSGAAGQAAAALGPVPPAAATEGAGDFAALHGLYWLTANLCAAGPLALVVDDLHWADAPSLRFLRYLLPRLEGLPLLVLGALRPAEPGAEAHLLAALVTDPASAPIRLGSLSAAATRALVQERLGPEVDETFLSALHASTAGNPLLVSELAAAAAAEGLPATRDGVVGIRALAPRALGRRLDLRLAGLGPEAAALARAVAVLGDGADPEAAAALAGLGPADAARAARALAAVEVLRAADDLGFVHPLVRAAVYEALAPAERADDHARAARLLDGAGAAPEAVGAHLLLTPPAGDPSVVAGLGRAADEASGRGAPEGALAYLERALLEPPPEDSRAELLARAGEVAQLLDMVRAAEHLGDAVELVDDRSRRAGVAEMLGRALFMLGRHDDALEVFSTAIRALGEHETDPRRRLEAGLINLAGADPRLTLRVGELLGDPPDGRPGEGLGARMLDCLIALRDAFAGLPYRDVAARARRGLDGGALLAEATGLEATAAGCYALVAADRPEAMESVDGWLAIAHRRGSTLAYAVALQVRALAWLARGSLPEAETDARESMRAIETARCDACRPLLAAILAQTLMELGRLADAAAALDWAEVPGPVARAGHRYGRASLLVAQGRHEEGLEEMLACGRRYEEGGGRNPAFVPWRSGAVPALDALGRRPEAARLAAEEVELARRFGAPRALSRALRAAARAAGREEGVTMLRAALEVAAPSPARLEHAKAEVELGAALRRGGLRAEAREHLRRGIDLAERCGAEPLSERARVDLLATGARPRRLRLTGVAALTPSERRVAERAAAGDTNREIAQALFVTAKTVEVHLGSAYRKLGLRGRRGLPEALAADGAEASSFRDR